MATRASFTKPPKVLPVRRLKKTTKRSLLHVDQARMYRDMLVASDIRHSPEALILSPENVIRISQAIVKSSNGFQQTLKAVQTAYTLIEEARLHESLKLREEEVSWLETVPFQLELASDNESDALDLLISQYGDRFDPASYGL